jgi:hypothetical protein
MAKKNGNELSLEQVIAAVKEFNTVCELNPPIDESADIKSLRSEIKDSLELIKPDDKFTDGTKEVLVSLGWNPEEKTAPGSDDPGEKGEEKVAKKKTAKKKKEPVEKKTVTKKTESRPGMLRRKISEGVKKLDDLLNDKELLKKYNDNTTWIKADFNKIKGKK